MINLIGKVFGKLKVLDKYDNSNEIGRKRLKWVCRCECGNTVIVLGEHLRYGNTKSCGCLRGKKRNLPKNSNRLYNIWRHMKDRCYNNNAKSYKYYGARGISVCKEWNEDFINFYNWAIYNGYNETLTLDRINVNENYCPSNCRWATKREQNNNKRNNNFITYNGKTLTLTQWANIYGINPNTLKSRIKSKKIIDEDVFNTKNIENYSKYQIIEHINKIQDEVKQNIISINNNKYIEFKYFCDIIEKIIKELN